MSKRDKLLEKLRKNPTDCTFAEVQNVLIDQGFVLRGTRGSHHVIHRGSTIFVLPVHGKRVKTVYVKRLLPFLDFNAHSLSGAALSRPRRGICG